MILNDIGSVKSMLLCLVSFLYHSEKYGQQSLSLSHWYPRSGVVLDCIDS